MVALRYSQALSSKPTLKAVLFYSTKSTLIPATILYAQASALLLKVTAMAFLSNLVLMDESCTSLKKAYTVSNFLRSEEHTSELQSRPHLVCRLLLEKKNDSISTRATISPPTAITLLLTHPTTTETYTLSLHDALPISSLPLYRQRSYTLRQALYY